MAETLAEADLPTHGKMKNFKVGDRIRVIGTAQEAVILKIETSFAFQIAITTYHVVWDNFPEKGQCSYMSTDVDSLWEKIDIIADTVTLPVPNATPYWYQVQGKSDPENTKGPIKFGCDHKWVEVGFTHTKTVCYHCDIERK